MPTSTADNRGTADADLVARALAGDREALAGIYDAYADRIHTMCVHMLGDRDEAADVCGEVFLVAFQRLAQLRDPSRLRPWLYAICRHEIYRRTKRRGRVRLVEEVNEMDQIAARDRALDHDDADTTDGAALALLVRQAADGLDERDRTVLELQLQGVEGDDLAAALGTSTSTSYQHVHRMRERMERSIGALLVARQGRRECGDLDRLLAGWDGTFSVLWRKRVARHVDGCEVCERRRRAVPAALLGTAGASPLVVTPISIRERVLDGARVGSAPGRGGWQRDGFPPAADDGARRGVLGAVAAIVVLLLLAGGVWWLSGEDTGDVTVTAAASATTTSTTAVGSTTEAPTSAPDTTTVVAETVPSTVLAAPPTSVGGTPTTVRPASPTTSRAPATVAPPTAPPTTAPPTTSTTSTTTTTIAPPGVRLVGPTVLYARGANGGTCSNQPFVATITSGTATTVTLQWTAGSASGTVAMTQQRVRGRWNGIVDVPFGTTGFLSATATATNASGGAGVSAPATIRISPCPVIG